jgi:hypothetical protein
MTFYRAFGKASSLKRFEIENYVGKDPSEPPLLHRFRDVEKDKWVNGAGFRT